MNSFINRLNIVGLYTLMMLLVITLLSNISLLTYNPQPYIGIHNIDVLTYAKPTYPSPYSHIYMHQWQFRHKNALLLKFDVDLDLKTTMSWSTKQVMVWLVLEYHTKTPLHDKVHEESPHYLPPTVYEKNQVVIWDYIVHNDFDLENNDELDVFIEGMEVKYPLGEVGGEIDFDKPITLKLQWEITPVLGFFQIFNAQEKHTKTLDLSHKIQSVLAAPRGKGGAKGDASS